ncbi:MAG TPA: L-threonylcarbamoyladenylate synthase [Phnomibacter sp.]|nr:L-threonylcarbamoyladenylate synthase [Phnomibacter sp.]
MTTIIGTDLGTAAGWLKQDELVAIPTETVYGLAGNALSETAVLKIFKAKGRPHFNPLIVHTHSWEAVSDLVKEIPEAAMVLASHFCPGPITFLLEKTDRIPDLVTAGHPKVAVRIPAHPLTQQLLANLNFPLAAPSANRFGYVSPTTAEHVLQGLNGVIPYILDGGACNVGVESTIVDLEGDQIIIRRRGGITASDILRTTGLTALERIHASDHPVAPGQLKSHYATTTPLFTGNLAELSKGHKWKKIAVIGFGSIPPGNFEHIFNLSPSGDTDEAARNLFAMMRQADNCGADVILAAKLPEKGLGAAVNDRLQRAQHLNKA